MLVRFPSVNSKKQARENSTMASIGSRMKECQRACLGVQSVQRRDSKLLLPIYIPLLWSETQGTELCLLRAASYAYLSQCSKYRDLNKTKHWKKSTLATTSRSEIQKTLPQSNWWKTCGVTWPFDGEAKTKVSLDSKAGVESSHALCMLLLLLLFC